MNYSPLLEDDCVSSIIHNLEAAAAADLYDGHAARALEMLKRASPHSLVVRSPSSLPPSQYVSIYIFPSQHSSNSAADVRDVKESSI